MRAHSQKPEFGAATAPESSQPAGDVGCCVEQPSPHTRHHPAPGRRGGAPGQAGGVRRAQGRRCKSMIIVTESNHKCQDNKQTNKQSKNNNYGVKPYQS